MTRNDAIHRIKAITGGEGINREKYPERMRGKVANHSWNEGLFFLGFEYGYILALMDVFEITENDLD